MTSTRLSAKRMRRAPPEARSRRARPEPSNGLRDRGREIALACGDGVEGRPATRIAPAVAGRGDDDDVEPESRGREDRRALLERLAFAASAAKRWSPTTTSASASSRPSRNACPVGPAQARTTPDPTRAQRPPTRAPARASASAAPPSTRRVALGAGLEEVRPRVGCRRVAPQRRRPLRSRREDQRTHRRRHLRQRRLPRARARHRGSRRRGRAGRRRRRRTRSRTTARARAADRARASRRPRRAARAVHRHQQRRSRARASPAARFAARRRRRLEPPSSSHRYAARTAGQPTPSGGQTCVPSFVTRTRTPALLPRLNGASSSTISIAPA